ncbi:MAG: glycosyltransferase family 2 protein [Rhizobium sp.]|nr:glycosyltransferase family 2 protein [Rhizobium sp.]
MPVMLMCNAQRSNGVHVSVSKVAIVLLNWNGWRDTNACLESLLDLQNDHIGIFVCDNASSDDSVAQIRSWAETGLAAANARRLAHGRQGFDFLDLSALPSDGQAPSRLPEGGLDTITLIQTGRNGGFAAGNNVGIRHALAGDFDYFWLLNNDTEVEPDALTWLIRRMEEDPQVGMCGSTLIYHGQRDLIQNWGGASFIALKGRGIQLGERKKPSDPIDRSAVEAQLGYISGASMFVSRAFLEQVGLMQEDYFLYWEELDWATRARGLFKLGYAPKSVVYHKVGASIGTNDFGDRSPLSDYYMARGRVKFCSRFSKISLPFAIADISRDALRWGARGNWSRAGLLVRAIIGLPYVKPA